MVDIRHAGQQVKERLSDALSSGALYTLLFASIIALFGSTYIALVFLVFTLLYTPCVAAIAAVRREMGSAKAAVGVVVAQCVIAWVVAFLVHCVGLLFGLV